MQQENPDRRFERLEHQLESLGAEVEADMKVSQAQREQAKAENDSAFDRLRADMERGVNAITVRLMVGLTISVAFLSLVVAFTGVFLRT